MKIVKVPEWQKQLAPQLREIEKSIEEMIPSIPAAEKAKCYVSLAYDWYSMGANAEGQKLIKKAEAVCPGYFSKEARKQMAESPTFNYLMNNIALLLKEIIRNQK